MRMRKFTSIMLMVIFIIVSVTGIQIDISAKKSFFLARLHERSGYTLIVLALIHMLFNYKSMLAYIRIRNAWTSTSKGK